MNYCFSGFPYRLIAASLIPSFAGRRVVQKYGRGHLLILFVTVQLALKTRIMRRPTGS